VVACDTPLPQPDLLRALRQAGEDAGRGCLAMIPQWNGLLQPLLACYSAAALEPMAAALSAGERAPIQALAGREYETFSPAACRRYDPMGKSFININTPEDLTKLDDPQGRH